MSRSRRAIAVVAVPLAGLAATLVSGCSADEIGAAANVGDQKITVSQLQSEVEAYTESLPDAPDPTGDVGNLQHTVLQRMIHHELFQALAQREKIEVTDAQIDSFLDDFKSQQGGDLTQFMMQSGFTEESIRPAVYDELVRQQLTQVLGGDQEVADAVTKVADELDVQVNPRYGRWEGLQLDPVSGSLSTPAER